MEIRKPEAIHYFEGVITGKDVITSKKVYKDAVSFYKKRDPSLPADTVMYEVYQYVKDGVDTKKQVCDLYWGLTVLYPIRVMGECNMTRGHWHENQSCVELYIGVEGTGLLMLMDHSGKTWCEEVFKGSLHHIDGSFAHRLLNTGDTICKVAACWPKEAGHDYDAVRKQPFGYRVMKQQQNLTFEHVEVTYEK